MSHDSEQEVRLQFLEEAFEHCHQIESGLLGIGSNGVDRQQIDGVLRAAHSVKGGAALMGFHNLSHLAHRLEDFFKVLKIGKVQVDGETESLLLTGMDFMRQVATLNQQGEDVDEQWLETQAYPIMEQLHDILGDPQPEDEASLLSSEVGEDMSSVLFESEVEECLTRLEEQMASQDASLIVAEFDSTLEELGGLGEMLDMPAFHGLCQSTLQYLKSSNDPNQQIKIAEVGLQELRRSQAMVLVGQKDAIPGVLDVSSLGEIASAGAPADVSADLITEEADPFAGVELSLDPLDLGGADLAEPDLFAGANLDDLETPELEAAAAEPDLFAGADLGINPQELEVAAAEADLFAGADLELEPQDLEVVAPQEATPLEETPTPEQDPQLAPTADLDAFADVDLAGIAEEIESLAPEETAAPALEAEQSSTQKETAEEVEWSESFAAEAVDLISSLDSTATEQSASPVAETPKPAERKPRKRASTRTVAKPMATGATAPEAADTTIRVPVSKLNQLNELFGELIIERNGLQMQLKQLRNLTDLLRDRVHTLDKSNAQLRAAYDKISVQEVSAQAVPSMAAVPVGVGGQANGSDPPTSLTSPHLDNDFDLLEMDRYSEMHLLSQELMEAAVQIQEVTGDINTGLGDAEQTTRGLTRTSKLIQTSMTQVRMRPVSELLSRFPRVLRDLSLRFGKQVELKIIGGSTLVDRSILESLNDPLIHLIRNSFDHGIEKPEARVAAGKSPKGVIEIRATYRGNQTQITIKDDGGGINLDKIKGRAMEMGLDAEDLRNASTSDLLDLIFEPGFSTASAVTDLSGRGVGMDVVRTNLQKIRGSIAVDTEAGVGTTFTISVPFTLSVIRVLLVEVANMMLAFPTDIVEEMMLLNPEDIMDSAGAEVLNWDGEMVPLVRLNQWLQLPRIAKLPDTEETPSINSPTILMVEDGNELVGLQVDRYWSEQEVTIRQAEGNIAMPEGFAGCTILGDGRVIPLVDALSLLNWMNDRNNDFTGSSSALADALSGSDDPMVDTASQQALVMVVDDSVNVRRFLALTLEKAGYRVEQAKDGQHALEKLESGLPIQAVVCDIEMPRMDGYGFLAHVKAKPDFKSIPVAMLTSRSGDKHRKLAMTLGASAYFSKPFREKELLQTLEQFTQAK